MDSTAYKVTTKEEIKSKLLGFMEDNGIKYNLVECCGCERICIDLKDEENICEKYCCNSGIIIHTSSKDILRICPHEILYIAIEKRKSVLYLKDRRVETNYNIDYWLNLLDLNVFAQPHHSFIVNLNYVKEVNKDFVKVRFGDKEYSVYTSSRKISAFKKAFLNFKG